MPESMTSAEARRILARLGWTQEAAAMALGISQRRMRDYLAPDGEMPAGRAELLRRLAKDEERKGRDGR